jgi:type II secretory pathway component PulM
MRRVAPWVALVAAIGGTSVLVADTVEYAHGVQEAIPWEVVTLAVAVTVSFWAVYAVMSEAAVARRHFSTEIRTLRAELARRDEAVQQALAAHDAGVKQMIDDAINEAVTARAVAALGLDPRRCQTGVHLHQVPGN